MAAGLSAAVAGSMLALVWWRTGPMLTEHAGVALEASARAHLAAVVDNLARCRAAVAAGSRLPWVVDLSASAPPGSREVPQLAALGGACPFDGWAVLSPDGRLVAQWFRDLAAGGRAVASWVERGRQDGSSISWVGGAGPLGQGVLVVAAPIQVVSRRTSGRLLGLVGPDAIAQWLPREPETGSGALHWLLTDLGGRPVATSGISSDLAPLGPIAAMRAEAGGNAGGHGVGTADRTTWVFGYAVDPAQTRHVLAAFTDRAAATAGGGSLGWQAAALGGALVLLGLGAGAAAGARLSARILGFADAVDAMRESGSLAVRAEGGSGEMGRLARSLNAMLESLSRKTADLIRRAEDAREAHRSTTQLIVSGLAHQLNNPLSGMIDCVEELRSGSLGADASREYLELVGRGLDRIHSIVSRLSSLEVTTGDADDITEMEPTVRSVIGLRHVQIDRMDLRVRLSADAWLVVRTDAAVLSDLVDNLLSNAIAASARGGAIEIDLTQTSREMVAVRVRDHGAGMRPEELKRLGEPFYSRRKDGVGLGMWTVRTYVEALGGAIDVASAPSEGTTVTVTLPGAQMPTRGGPP
ncbi:MAG TPA: HAMP domain-containing sensor histidine kinase [Anaeromyxobacteraceae bacterium]